MFDEVAEKLYTLCIQKRQYGFYVGNLKIYSIPAAVPTFTFPSGLQIGSALSNNIAIQQSKDDLNAIAANVPTTTAGSETEKFCDMRYYNELLNSFPAEYISTPVILHCMIEQVLID